MTDAVPDAEFASGSDGLGSTPSVHVIRLRGPWKYQPVECTTRTPPGLPSSGAVPPGGTMPLPASRSEIMGDEFTGKVRFTRRFGRPTNVAATERIYLIVGGAALEVAVWLNGDRLSASAAAPAELRFDVTLLLKPRNELMLEFDFRERSATPAERGFDGELWIGDVRLEIAILPTQER